MNPNDLLGELGASCESELLRMLIEQVPYGVFIKDRKGRFLISNAVYGRFSGARDPGQMVGKTDADCYPEDRALRATAEDQKVLQAGETLASDERLVLAETGETRWLKTTRQPLRNRRGQIIGLVGICRDDTAHRREADALRSAHDEKARQAAELSAARSVQDAELLQERVLLRTVIDNLPDGIYAKDTAFRKTLSNRADLENIRCHSEAEALGKTDFDFFSKEEATRFMADDRAVMESGKPVVNREEFFFDAAGRKHWLQTTKLPLRDRAGRIAGLVGIGRDITSLKEAEEARKTSEARLDQILGQADCMLWQATVGREGDQLQWKHFEVPKSGLYASIFGLPRHPDGGAMWSLVNVPELPEMGRRARESVLGGAPGYSQQFRVVQGDRTLWLRELVSITATGPNEWNLVGVITDITRQHEAEQKVDALNRDLVKASRSAGMAEVATGVLHNVGNVLNSVNVSAGLVADRLRASKADGVAKLARLCKEHRRRPGPLPHRGRKRTQGADPISTSWPRISSWSGRT